MASSAVAETPSEKVFCEAWHYSAKHNRPVLGYSGGAESNLLLELLRPFQNVLTVRWVNAAALPHMAEYVRRRTRGWCFVELTSSPEGSFRAFGIPSTILPIDAVPVLRGDKHMPPDTPHLPPSGEASCGRVRSLPKAQRMAANRMNLLVHGQRAGEGALLFLNGLPRSVCDVGANGQQHSF